MIISDLQYIESVTDEVQGSSGRKGWGWGRKKNYRKNYYNSEASASAYADAFGKNTKAYANTYTFTAPGVSSAGSNSYSSSSGWYH